MLKRHCRILICTCLLLSISATASALAENAAWSLQSIQDRLASAGIRTKTDVLIHQPFLSAAGRVLVAADGTEIQVYIYKDAAARERESAKLDPKRAAPANVQPSWLMPVSLVTSKNATLIVLSRDPAIHRKVADVFAATSPLEKDDGPEQLVRRFHEALQQRDVKAIEKLVASELVVFENGERNDGWADFRDNHLVPEMQEPAPESKWELVKVKAGSDLAWAYTHETFTSPRGAPIVVWSVFVLEKRTDRWKITALDWSVGRPKSK